jgi:hypothetical protein
VKAKYARQVTMTQPGEFQRFKRTARGESRQYFEKLLPGYAMVFHADDVAEVKVTSVCGSAAANQDVATFRLGKVPHSRQRQRTPLLMSTAL